MCLQIPSSFSKWDGVYFLDIAESGYRYEQVGDLLIFRSMAHTFVANCSNLRFYLCIQF